MAERPPAPDQPARDRITADLGSTLFVEAGAGSGKTTALIDRILALVGTGTVELRALAAITFTEKAAAELRDRLRRQLEQQAAVGEDAAVRDRCRRALHQLDAAAVGTLHAFAQRLLGEHPIEAGLPPRVEVLDEVSSGVAFDERWRAFLDDLLADPSLERALVLLHACGGKVDALRAVARTFDENWDLVAERVTSSPGEVAPVHDMVGPVLAEIRAICATPCRDPDDRLRQCLDDIADWVATTEAITDELALLAVLESEADAGPPSFRPGNRGRPANYDCDVKELRERIRAAGDRLSGVRAEVAEACVARIGARIAAFTLASAAERRAAGTLEFHDLLVLARELLRDPDHGPAVRAQLHDRYRRLLLDESQDTDPIQLELAVRIAAADPGSQAAGTAPWTEVPVADGQLFFVGDPKQSIYRFRRADVAMFLAARQRFGADTGGLVELTANFRTTEPIIEWANAVFGSLMSPAGPSRSAADTQPTYVALQAVRPAAPDGPPVSVLGRSEHPPKASADDLRRAEAADVAATVTRILAEGWAVAADAGDADTDADADTDTDADGDADGDGAGGDGGGWRPARLGDVTVLLPARTSLPFLEDAFDDAGVAYRAESSSLVYATRAVRDLLMVVRAVDDPTDSLRVVSALRTPLLGCGDDDLFRFKVERRGHWNYLADQPDGLPAADPVHRALRYLRDLHDQRHWLGPSELLDRVAVDRRALELGFAEGRPRDVWRRLRFVIDQARAWHEATGGNLRQYLRWVDSQTADGARVEEVVLPETDDDAVRILTIHAAKGLEFPITIVSGLSTQPQNSMARAQAVFPPGGGVGYRVGKGLATTAFEQWVPIDEQMAHDERIRLLYVACTRARDHLVVSLHRKARASVAVPARQSNAELLVAGIGQQLDDLPDGPAGSRTVVTTAPVPPEPPAPFDAWSAERDIALERASQPTTVAATALTDEGAPDTGDEGVAGTGDELRLGLDKRARDLDLPPWLRGRYGSAVGRAVHGVLQVIDLTGAGDVDGLGTGDGVGTGGGDLDAAVAAQCEAEAIAGREADVRYLVAAALRSPTVVEAAAASHWRELYVCVPVGSRLLEGYVDLLYRRPGGGLVVVDYKTAGTADADELDRRVAGYRHQGASYALAVAEATGEPVEDVVFVFLTPAGAIERRLPDLPDAVAGVRRLVEAGAESVLA